MSLSWKFRRLLASAITDLVLWGAWLLVVTGSLVLPIYLGITFLSTRNCQPHKDLSFPPGFMSGFEINPVNVNVTEKEKSLIEMVFPADITLELGGENVSVPVLPLHLFKSGSLIAYEILEKYSPGDVAVHCKVNGIKRNGVVSLGVSVCNSTLSDLLGEEQVSGLKAWLSGLAEGVEGKVVNSFMSGNLTETIQLLPEIFVDAGNFKLVLDYNLKCARIYKFYFLKQSNYKNQNQRARNALLFVCLIQLSNLIVRQDQRLLQ